MILEIHYDGNVIEQVKIPDGLRINNLKFSLRLSSKADKLDTDKPVIDHSKYIRVRHSRPGSIPRPIRVTDLQGNEIGLYASTLDTANKLGLRQRSIIAAVSRETSYNNKRFQYADE